MGEFKLLRLLLDAISDLTRVILQITPPWVIVVLSMSFIGFMVVTAIRRHSASEGVLAGLKVMGIGVVGITILGAMCMVALFLLGLAALTAAS